MHDSLRFVALALPTVPLLLLQYLSLIAQVAALTSWEWPLNTLRDAEMEDALRAGTQAEEAETFGTTNAEALSPRSPSA